MPFTQEENRTLGKFEGNPSQHTARVLYDLLGVSGEDDWFGGVDEGGYYALIRGNRYGFICTEDGRGFFHYSAYPLDEANRLWDRARP